MTQESRTGFPHRKLYSGLEPQTYGVRTLSKNFKIIIFTVYALTGAPSTS